MAVMMPSRTTAGRSILRRSTILLALVAAAIVVHLLAAGPASAARRPNVVVIMTDDQRFDTLHAMPNVRELLRHEGTYFKNAFVPNALCCPSRVSTLTGLYSHTTGVYGNRPPSGGFDSFDDSVSVATVLNEAGYDTWYVGRYLNGYIGGVDENHSYVPPGWDRWFVMPSGSYFRYEVSADGTRVGPYGKRPRDYAARVMTRTALGYMDASTERRPFFLFYSATAPHASAFRERGARVPVPLERDVGRFRSLPPWRPPTYGNRDDVSDMPDFIRRRAWRPRHERRVDIFRQRQLESLASLDRSIGRLLERVPRNTLVIFLSDNGYLWGEHRWRSKRVPYEESIRVPLVVSWPGRVPQRVDRRLALNVDVVPTILGAARVDPRTPTGIAARTDRPVRPEGLDLLGDERREAFLLEFRDGETEAVPGYCGVRTSNDWTYVRYWSQEPEDRGFEELYDVARDPLQERNLASRVRWDEQRTALRTLAQDLCRPEPPGYSWDE
jgi:N-acetylglucosamine-6-sulfatase